MKGPTESMPICCATKVEPQMAAVSSISRSVRSVLREAEEGKADMETDDAGKKLRKISRITKSLSV
ncbi:hypothetical protein CQA4T8M7_06920 [Sphaerotilus natans]|nr:hypothetical protein CQA4T8M7_06920 [Sphaerotilus natans]